MTQNGGYFVQISDAHLAPMDREGNATLELRSASLGGRPIPPEDREYLVARAPGYLAAAVREITALDPQPAFILMTGDQVSCGTRPEIERFLEIVEPLSMPKYYNSSNHDLGSTPEAFEELIGPRRTCFDYKGLRFFVMGEYARFEGDKVYPWRAAAKEEHYAWLTEGLSGWNGSAVLVVHAPILPIAEGEYAHVWGGPGTQRFVDFLTGTPVRWLITGHWHRNMQWPLNDMTVINTGALGGFQCSGPPPFFLMPVRPGYRIFHWDGEDLRSHWHNLHAWIEAEIVTVGDAHTRGPRPQVCPVTLSDRATIRVQAYAPGTSVADVQWGLGTQRDVGGHKKQVVMTGPGWRPMERTWQGLWSEWKGQIDAPAYAAGEYVMLTRAMRNRDSNWVGHDAVPVTITRNEQDTPARCEGETLFALFGCPEGFVSQLDFCRFAMG